MAAILLLAVTAMAQTTVSSTPLEQNSMKGKIGVSLRISPQFFTTYTDLTIGYHLTDKSVLGVALGHGYEVEQSSFADVDHYHWHAMAFYHYGKQIRKSRFSLYSDFMIGGAYYYKVTNEVYADADKKGDIDFAISWQPGIAFRLSKDVKIFLGPAILPNVGVHVGLSYGL